MLAWVAGQRLAARLASPVNGRRHGAGPPPVSRCLPRRCKRPHGFHAEFSNQLQRHELLWYTEILPAICVPLPCDVSHDTDEDGRGWSECPLEGCHRRPSLTTDWELLRKWTSPSPESRGRFGCGRGGRGGPIGWREKTELSKIRPLSRGDSSEAYDAQAGLVGCKSDRMGVKMLALYVRSMDGGRQRWDIGSEKTLARVRAQLEKKTLIVENVVQLQQFCLATSLTMGSPPRCPSQWSITASGSWKFF